MIPSWAVDGLALRVRGAPRDVRAAAVLEAARQFGVSKATVYRKLQALDGRKPQTRVSEQERTWAMEVAGLVKTTMNQKGIAVSTGMAIRELERMGKLAPGALRRQRADELLRALGVTRKKMRQPRPCVRMTAAGPNAAHQVDFTVASAFYLENMWIGLEDEYKKVKRADRTKLLIGSCKDMYSRCMFAKAYPAKGESAELAVRFLFDAWSEKPDLGFPFQGVPWHTYTDQGPGMKAGPVQTLLDKLFVDWTGHAAGNSRATGQVERTFLDTARFEALMRARLACGHRVSVEEFNSWLFEFCVDSNSLPHPRFRDRSRFEVWQTIEDLRRCPEWDVFVNLTAVGEMRRKVSPYLSISLAGKEYFVGVSDLVGETVDVYLSADKQVWVQFEKRVYGPLAEGVPENVFGAEVKQAPLSQSERNVKEALAAAERMGFNRANLAYVRAEHAQVFVPKAGRKIQHKGGVGQADEHGRPRTDTDAEPVAFTEVWEAKRWLADRVGSLAELGWEALASVEGTLETLLERDGRIEVRSLEEIVGAVVGVRAGGKPGDEE